MWILRSCIAITQKPSIVVEVADQLLNAELAAQKKFAANSMFDDADEEDLYSDEDEEEEPKYETKEVYFL